MKDNVIPFRPRNGNPAFGPREDAMERHPSSLKTRLTPEERIRTVIELADELIGPMESWQRDWLEAVLRGETVDVEDV